MCITFVVRVSLYFNECDVNDFRHLGIKAPDVHDEYGMGYGIRVT